MIDAAGFKQTLKDADDGQAIALFCWAKACMEVRGLIPIEDAAPTRKRRSDAGQSRNQASAPAEGEQLNLREPQS